MKSKALAIIYTFVPYVDTAGIVFAKRIQSEIKKDITVISCKAYKGATIDDSLNDLVQPYLNKIIEIDSKFTYRDWTLFEDFYNKALDAYEKEILKGEIYSELYSRSMSVISHLVAYTIKKRNPEIKWIAEFSDPIIKDVTGENREAILPDKWLKKNLEIDQIEYFSQYNNLFSLSEILVYLYADEIKFTNPLQKDFMLKYISEDILCSNSRRIFFKKVHDKSIIIPHPILAKEFYGISNISIDVDRNRINIAYFGNINSKRSFNVFFDSWLTLSSYDRNKFRFYIFSNLKKETILKNIPTELVPYIILGGNLKYLDFLGSLKYFDYLLTVDTEVKDIFGINPFLPSKVADYLGSDTKILAIVEEQSPTSKISNGKLYSYNYHDFNFRKLRK